MQLRHVLATLLLGGVLYSQAQVSNKQDVGPANFPGGDEKAHQEAEIDILFDYYRQDGDHSPVTGGEGTEKLSNAAPVILVNIPLDTLSRLSLNFGVDYYSSASTNNIDKPPFGPEFQTSGASSSDVRAHFDGTYQREVPQKNRSWEVGAGFSSEFDVVSGSLTGRFLQKSVNQNHEWSIGAKIYLDSWAHIFPIELRYPIENGTVKGLDAQLRQSYSLHLMYAFVVNKKLQMALLADGVYQKGLLSTPFHRVYFANQNPAEKVDIERLPDARWKIPVAARLSWTMSNRLVLRGYYRVCADTWGVNAQTVNVELPVRMGTFFTIYPFYRYHYQTKADYFAPFAEHNVLSEFYTSDYDLSEFHSHMGGVGMKIAPLKPLASFHPIFNVGRQVRFKSIDLRAGYYKRSDGLHAFNIAAGFGFVF